jgi:hypothetical protein
LVVDRSCGIGLVDNKLALHFDRNTIKSDQKGVNEVLNDGRVVSLSVDFIYLIPSIYFEGL